MKQGSLIFIIIAFALQGYCQEYKGAIIRVIDGDTYVFQTEEGSFTVRMQGIDAPERDQPFSKESSEYLKQYLNKEAILVSNGIDRYSRILGTIIIEGEDINLLSIKGGFSWHYREYSKDLNYEKAEEYARKNKLGLWKLDNPNPPWIWRQKPRSV